MQTDPTTIKLILALSDLGWPSRKIAHVADVSKSTVNNYIAAAALREQFAAYVEYQAAVPERQVKNISSQDRLARSFENLKAACIENALPHVPSVYLAPDASAEMKEIYEQFKEIAGNVQASATPPRILYHPELQYDPKDVAFNQPKKQGPRILVWDCESAPALAYTFGRWKQNIGQDNIAQEGGWIICASYKWLGEDETHLLYDEYDISTASDDYVVDRLWHLYDEADAVVAHNALGFDHKVLQARCLVNQMEPLPNVKVLDTLVMAKKNFRLPSNKLDSIAELLGLGRKNPTGGIGLWIDTMNGDAEQLQKMLEYCKQDTALLEEVYMRLRTFGTASNFNAANYYDDDKERCNICGSTELEATGRSVFTDVSKFQEIRCKNCGGIHRKRQVLNSKEKRKSLLAAAKI